jgi:hypothetical protein
VREWMRPSFLLGIAFPLILGSLGCSYALPVPSPPFRERVRVVSPSPERYSLRLATVRSEDLPVPPDGRLTLSIPPIQRGCTVHFLGIKVSDGYDPFKEWTIAIYADGKSLRRLSLTQLNKLPTDPDGYRLLAIAGPVL